MKSWEDQGRQIGEVVAGGGVALAFLKGMWARMSGKSEDRIDQRLERIENKLEELSSDVAELRGEFHGYIDAH